MKYPSGLGATLLLLLWGVLRLSYDSSVAAERVRGGSTRRARRQQIRTLKRRGYPIKYSRLLVDEWDDEDGDITTDPTQRRHRRLPPSKVSKGCSSKSLKGSKDGSGKASKGGSGKASKSKNSNVPTCDTTTAFCSCPSCTQEVLDRMAGDYTCGARMEFLLTNYPETFGKTRQACGRVAGLEFPEECGECDPNTCDGRNRAEPRFYCGCQTCDDSVWDRDAGGYSCGARISWSMIVDQQPQAKACTLVSGQYPQCAQCNPDTCTARTTASPTPKQEPIAPPSPSVAPATGDINVTMRCACTTCTADVWDADTGNNITCGDRIDWLMANMNLTEAGACAQIASSEFPEACSPCDPSTCAESPVSAPTALAPVTAPTAVGPVTAPTGAAPVTAPTPAAPVTAPTPAAPVMAPTAAAPVMAPMTAVAPVTAPTAQGPVAAPTTTGLAPVTAPTAVAPVAAVAPTAVPPPTTAVAPSSSSGNCPAVTADTALYCFRNASDRVAYDSVWGSYRVEVKRDPDNVKCAPNANRFSEDTVALNGDELSLKFRKTSGGWLSSEVRIVLPNSEMYSYGYYEFSVKSVAVRNRTTREVTDYTLPPELVFGMFTYDPRDNCQESVDTYFREVDMELSRWGFGGNSTLSTNATTTSASGNGSALDGMFLVQPPDESIQTYRFYTGTNQDYNQGGHTYGFYWHPTNLTWQTSAGGGRTFAYTSQQATDAGLPDRVQCLPAPIDVRINLWNLNTQATDASLGLSDDQLVEVIVDRFTYAPSGVTGVTSGDFCTKDCQCESGFVCSGNACATAA